MIPSAQTIGKRNWAAYGLAIAATAAMLWWRIDIGQRSGESPLLMLFLLPVVFCAHLGGVGPGLLATFVAALGTEYFLIPPAHSLDTAGLADLAQWLILIVVGCLVSVLSGALQRSRRRAEAAQRLHSITLANIGEAVITTGTDGIITSLNGMAEALTGWTEAEAVGLPVTTVLRLADERTGETRPSVVAEILSSGIAASLADHTVVVARDGRKIPVEDSGAPIRAADGRVVGVILVLRDCSDKRMAVDLLRASEARFATAFRASPLGIAITHYADGRFLDVNDAWLRIFGHNRDEVIGRTAAELMLYVSPAQRTSLIKMLKDHTRAPHCEMPLRTKSGRVIITFFSAEVIHLGKERHLLTTVSDITQQKNAEQSLRESRERYRSLFENMLDGYAYCRMLSAEGPSADFVYLDVNPAFARLTGLRDVVGRRASEVSPGIRESDPELFHICGRVAATGLPERFETRVNALGLWLSIAVYSPSRDHFVVVFDNVTERKKSEEQLHRLAHHDSLTGLPNRLLLRLRLDSALEHARRAGSRVAVLFLDLDHFNVVNDSLGHPAGDELLQAVAQRLSDRLREVDTLARLGGDEFVVVLEHLAKPEQAAGVARDIIERLKEPFVLGDGTDVYIGGSIGISLYPDDGEEAELLIQHADTALYQAKEDGRNGWHFYTSAQTATAQERRTMEAAIRRALDGDEFVLHYQPLVSLPDGRPIGVEALVRWRKPDAELIPPGSFIPLAEQNGLIVPLGEWVLRAACERMKGWRDAGLELDTLAVNLSPRQFRQADLHALIRTVLAETGLPPSCLELEITEGAIMEQGREAESRMAALKSLGVRLAIDDFGTGYSSLAYLKRFPLDKLKIDQSFVRDIPNDPADMEITATIIAMARTLKLAVLAEGIETTGQLDFLNRHQCEIGQGYLFSPPMEARAFEQWMGEAKGRTLRPKEDAATVEPLLNVVARSAS